MEQAQVQVYMGDGKGKTTAAIGLAVRAVGAGKKVCMIQFIKDMEYHEIPILRKIGVDVILGGSGSGCFIDRNPEQFDLDAAAKTVALAKEAIQSGKYDVVILDEINIACVLKLLTPADMLSILQVRPDTVEVVLTGRGCPQEVLDQADLITEMKEIRHYYNTKGLLSRDGIER